MDGFNRLQKEMWFCDYADLKNMAYMLNITFNEFAIRIKSNVKNLEAIKNDLTEWDKTSVVELKKLILENKRVFKNSIKPVKDIIKGDYFTFAVDCLEDDFHVPLLERSVRFKARKTSLVNIQSEKGFRAFCAEHKSDFTGLLITISKIEEMLVDIDLFLEERYGCKN